MSKFSQHLKDEGLAPSTREKYNEIVTSASGSDNLLEWVRKKVNSRQPTGTNLPIRAAIKHYLMAEKGYTAGELKELLPRPKGRPAAVRHALTPSQLAIYHAAVDQIDVEPSHTILELLPTTGMRISEITRLRQENIEQIDGRLRLRFRGKRDKERVIPLTKSGEKTLRFYMKNYEIKGWLFPGQLGGPITPHAVRKYTRLLSERYPDLPGLCPHQLRHTCLSMLLRKGVDLRTIQEIAGHESLATTQRYLTVELDMLQSAVDRLDG